MTHAGEISRAEPTEIMDVQSVKNKWAKIVSRSIIISAFVSIIGAVAIQYLAYKKIIHFPGSEQSAKAISLTLSPLMVPIVTISLLILIGKRKIANATDVAEMQRSEAAVTTIQTVNKKSRIALLVKAAGILTSEAPSDNVEAVTDAASVEKFILAVSRSIQGNKPLDFLVYRYNLDAQPEDQPTLAKVLDEMLFKDPTLTEDSQQLKNLIKISKVTLIQKEVQVTRAHSRTGSNGKIHTKQHLCVTLHRKDKDAIIFDIEPSIAQEGRTNPFVDTLLGGKLPATAWASPPFGKRILSSLPPES